MNLGEGSVGGGQEEIGQVGQVGGQVGGGGRLGGQVGQVGQEKN